MVQSVIGVSSHERQFNGQEVLRNTMNAMVESAPEGFHSSYHDLYLENGYTVPELNPMEIQQVEENITVNWAGSMNNIRRNVVVRGPESIIRDPMSSVFIDSDGVPISNLDGQPTAFYIGGKTDNCPSKAPFHRDASIQSLNWTLRERLTKYENAYMYTWERMWTFYYQTLYRRRMQSTLAFKSVRKMVPLLESFGLNLFTWQIIRAGDVPAFYALFSFNSYSKQEQQIMINTVSNESSYQSPDTVSGFITDYMGLHVYLLTAPGIPEGLITAINNEDKARKSKVPVFLDDFKFGPMY